MVSQGKLGCSGTGRLLLTPRNQNVLPSPVHSFIQHMFIARLQCAWQNDLEPHCSGGDLVCLGGEDKDTSLK